MLTGDVATRDAQGYLRVVGRTADFIIRGGQNVSAPVVEGTVATHAAVALAAAVAMPDEVVGADEKARA
jgi:acyl-CoA synthetase